MPLALLLQKTFTSLGKGVKQIDNWNQLVRLEQLLIGRARSAFLVHWFGPHLPLNGLSLRTWIVNIEALKQRYQAVRAGGNEAAGPNLLEPLAGMGGTIAGILLSPPVSLPLSFAAFKYSKSWLITLVAVLNIIFLGILIPAVGILLGGGLVLPAAEGAGLVGADLIRMPMVRNLYDLLGATAGMMIALNAFLEQLIGPRAQIKNPLLSQGLAVLDRLASFFPFVIALVAVIITRIGSLLVPLTRQLLALSDFIDEASSLISFILGDWIDHLKALADKSSPFLVVLRLLDTTRAMFRKAFTDNIRRALEEAANLLRSQDAVGAKSLAEVIKQNAQIFGKKVEAWKKDAVQAVQDAFNSHPLIKALHTLELSLKILRHIIETAPLVVAIKAVIKSVGSLLPSKPATPTSTPASGSTLSKITDFLGVAPPELSDIADIMARTQEATGVVPLGLDKATISDVASLIDARRDALDAHYALSKEAWDAIYRAQQPIDIFGAQRETLRKQAKGLPKEVLQKAHMKEMQLSSMILAVVQRALQPQLGSYVATLTTVFQKLDELIYHKGKSAPREEFPVRELAESNRLRPVVHSLRIHATTGDEPTIRTWGATLKRALEVQPYVLPAKP